MSQSEQYRQLIFDTETTGLDPTTGDRIVEIGFVELINRKKTGRTLHLYFNPELGRDKDGELIDLDPEVIKVHGLNIHELMRLSDGNNFTESAKLIFDFIKGTELVAHNASFDMGFLNMEMERAGIFHAENITKIEDVCVIRDTLVMAREKLPGRLVNLDNLCKIYNIENENRDYHGALLDSELLASVYLRMSQDQATLDFSEEAKSVKVDAGRLKIEVAEIPANLSSQLRSLRLSEESLQEHKELAKRITKESGEEYSWGF